MNLHLLSSNTHLSFLNYFCYNSFILKLLDITFSFLTFRLDTTFSYLNSFFCDVVIFSFLFFIIFQFQFFILSPFDVDASLFFIYILAAGVNISAFTKDEGPMRTYRNVLSQSKTLDFIFYEVPRWYVH